MKFINVFKNYTPNFVASLMGAIMIAIILGQKPANIATLNVTIWMIILFFLGLIVSWFILIKSKD